MIDAILTAAHLLAAGPTTRAAEAAGATFAGTAVSVHDGDSFHISGRREEIRLFGIDAPEEEFPGRWKAQPGADLSRETLRVLLGEETLTCTKRGTSYGRVVAVCTLPGGQDVGAAMVSLGAAWSYGGAYCADQDRARTERAMLWAADPPPTPPWTWRGHAEPRGTCKWTP